MNGNKTENRPRISKERVKHWHDVSTMKPEDFGDETKLPDDVKTMIRDMIPNRQHHESSHSPSEKDDKY